MSYFVYVLSSLKVSRLYIGSSANPDQRLKSHNFGRVKSTKNYLPWERILLEQHSSKKEATSRERYLKSGWGRAWLKKNVLYGGVAESGLTRRS